MDEENRTSLIYGNGTPPDLLSLNPIAYWKIADLSYSGGTGDIWVIPNQGLSGNTALANNMTIDTRVGEAPSSTNNALSYNMELNDRTTDVPT